MNYKFDGWDFFWRQKWRSINFFRKWKWRDCHFFWEKKTRPRLFWGLRISHFSLNLAPSIRLGCSVLSFLVANMRAQGSAILSDQKIDIEHVFQRQWNIEHNFIFMLLNFTLDSSLKLSGFVKSSRFPGSELPSVRHPFAVSDTPFRKWTLYTFVLLKFNIKARPCGL